MDIRFRDINTGIVEARAVVRLTDQILLNEITILSREGKIEVEFPQKTFKAKDGKVHNLDIILFDTEDQKNLFIFQVKEAFHEWRKKQKKVRIYES